MPNRKRRPVPGVLSAVREGGRAVLLRQVAGQAMIRSCATRQTLASGPTSGPETSQPRAARVAIRPAAGTAAAQPAEPTTTPARRGGPEEARPEEARPEEARPEELAGPAESAARAAQVAPERAGWVDRAGPSPQAGLVGSSTTTKTWWGTAIAGAAHRTPTAPVGARTLGAATLLATTVMTRAAPTSPAWAARSGRALHNTTAKGCLSTATVAAGSQTQIVEVKDALTRNATTPRACTATP